MRPPSGGEVSYHHPRSTPTTIVKTSTATYRGHHAGLGSGGGSPEGRRRIAGDAFGRGGALVTVPRGWFEDARTLPPIRPPIDGRSPSLIASSLDPEDLGLGRRELLVAQRARVVEFGELLDLHGRVLLLGRRIRALRRRGRLLLHVLGVLVGVPARLTPGHASRDRRRRSGDDRRPGRHPDQPGSSAHHHGRAPL